MEITIGKCYYNSFGEQVLLDEVVTTKDGKAKYIVTPLYEGEAIEMVCYGDSPTERVIPYEEQGEQRIVAAIYEDEPVAKLGEKAKAAAVRLEAIATTVGLLKESEKELKRSTVKLLKEEKEHAAHAEAAKSKKEAAEKALAKVLEQVDNARQRLSELEDAAEAHEMGDLNNELARLRKREFELKCLEAGGVDDWEWYGDSLEDYRKRYPNG